MRETSLSSKKATESQIKDEKQLSVLTDSVQQASDKFDEYERDKKINNEQITKLQTQVTELTDKLSKLSVQVYEQEQYSRRNCFLIHDVDENRNAGTDTLSMGIVNAHLGLDI